MIPEAEDSAWTAELGMFDRRSLMSGIGFLYLTQEEVIRLGALDMALAVQDVEEVFRLFASDQCVLPSKVVLRWGDLDSEMTRGRINAMPGYVGGSYNMAGLKWIASMPANPVEFGLPRASSLTILNDPLKGFPVAVMDGTLISAMRTGAVSGVAAKYLAPPDAQTVGIIGAGVQSRTQLMALKVAKPDLATAVVFDIREERTAAWCEDMRTLVEMDLEPIDSAEEAAHRADILVSATTAIDSVVKRGWVQPGTLYCQVGGHECEPEALLEFDRIVVDNWYEIQHRGAQALDLAKRRGFITDGDITAELGEIVLGQKPGRVTEDERIFFGAVGMGIEDVAVATRILRRAEMEGVGTMLTLWETPIFV
jgi:ornithine cyclodeaminase